MEEVAAVETRADANGPSEHKGARRSIYSNDFWLIFAATCALNSAMNLFLLFPLFIVKLGGGASTIGAVMGTGSGAALLMRPLASRAMDRYGCRMTALWTITTDVLIMMLYIPIGHLGWPIYLVRALHGAVEGTARVALFALVYEILPMGRQGEAMATFSLSGMGPAAVGALLGELIMRDLGFHAFFCAAAGLYVIAAIGVAALPRDIQMAAADKAKPATGDGPGYRELLIGSPLTMLWIVSLLFGLTNAVRSSFVAPFAYKRGIRSVGVYFSIYAVVAVLVRLSGRMLDRIGLERVLVPSFLVLALGIGLIAGAGYPGMLDVAAVLGGLGHGFAYPATSALIIRHTPAGATARSSTIYTSLWDLSAMIGPYLFGLIAHGFGYPPMFVIAGVLSLAAAIYIAAARQGSAATIAAAEVGS